MKRFTPADEWKDPWYRKLSGPAKLLKKFLWDYCDSAGVVSVDLELISFHVGMAVEEKHLAELGDWAERLPNGKYVIPSFIPFQCGELTPATCKAHRPVMKLVKAHSLVLSNSGYHYGTPDSTTDSLPDSLPAPLGSGSDRLPGSLLEKEKEKEKEKELEKEKEASGKGSAEGKPEVKPETPPTPATLKFPDNLNTPEFKQAWMKWQQFRNETRNKLTPTTIEYQLNELSKIGPTRAIAAINHTIFKGWRGLKEPDGAGSSGATATSARSAGIPERPEKSGEIGDLLGKQQQQLIEKYGIKTLPAPDAVAAAPAGP